MRSTDAWSYRPRPVPGLVRVTGSRPGFLNAIKQKMKKIFLFGLVVLCIFMFMGAAEVGSLPSLLQSSSGKRDCTGYTIIEYGKAIDCHGDTIALVYTNGFAQAGSR